MAGRVESGFSQIHRAHSQKEPRDLRLPLVRFTDPEKQRKFCELPSHSLGEVVSVPSRIVCEMPMGKGRGKLRLSKTLEEDKPWDLRS